jgi:hypothetical protein
VPDGEHLLDYPVAGVPLNAGVQAAQVSGIDPQTMTYKDYPGPYYDTLTAIGYDWKSFDLTTFQWSVPNDRVYFIQTGNSTIWKVQFLDFEGSATGVTTLEKTFQTSLVSAAAALPPIIPVFQLYPNPATDYVRIELELEERSSLPAAVRIFSATGRTLYRQSLTLNSGSNRIDLPLESLAPGAYYLNVELGAGQIVRPLIISR